MPFYLLYFIKVSLCLALVFLFYRLVLRKLTFYTWNRFYLSGYILFSFVVPFLDVSPVLEKNHWQQSQVIDWVPVIGQHGSAMATTVPATGLSVWQVVSMVLLGGMAILVVRLLVQFISFYRMKRKAIPLYEKGIKVYQVNDNIIPFSFGNAIYLNRHQHDESGLQEIIRHEFVHVKQRHSLDILLAELLCLVNWYNPFAWMLRKAIRQNLEFIADSKVLQNGVSRKAYQYLLLKVTGNYQYSIATQFNFSSLKKRIAMMNKIRSHRVNLLRFLFILPLAAVILISFRKQIGDKSVGRTTTLQSPEFLTDTVPGEKEVVAPKMPVPPPPPVPVKLPDHIQKINVRDKQVTVTLKNGDKESFNLGVPAQREAFEKKYGDLVPPPPPPPAPSMTGMVELKKVKGYEVSDKTATIQLADGTVETFNLKDKRERQAYEKKYGRIAEVEIVAPVATVAGHLLEVPVHVATTVAGHQLEVPVHVATTVTGHQLEVPVRAATTVKGNLSVAPDVEVAITGDGKFGPRITGYEDIIITITNKTTRQELEVFKKKMKEKGIDLDIEEAVYNKDGVITHLKGTMKSKGSSSNFSVTDFEKLTLAMAKDGDQTWFKVIVNDGKTSV